MRVGIFALSGPFDAAAFREGLGCLFRAGIEPVLAPGLDARQGYLAGPDGHRLLGLQALLAQEDLRVLLAARGGYGIHRILPKLPHARLQGRVVAGFSDVTALHCARFAVHGAWGLHCAVVTQLPHLRTEFLDATTRSLCSPERGVGYAGRPGSGPAVEGTLFGGNLALLCALLGTPHLVWPPDPILLLEDVGEAPYRLDRMLTQLELAGVPERLVGLAVGRFEGCPHPEGHPSPAQVVLERVDRWGLPWVMDLPIGHGPDNAPVPVGRRARIDPAQGWIECPSVA